MNKKSYSAGLRSNIVWSLALVLVLSLAGHTAAQQFPTITTEQLKKSLDAGERLVLIDTRTVPEFQEAHIKGAINIPEKEFESHVSLLPAEKNIPVVLYCSGVKCGKSKRVAPKFVSAGYTNVIIYSEGFPVWEEKGYPIVPGPDYEKKIETTKIAPADLKRLIDSGAKDYVLVDVRDGSEYREDHIPTAINIPAAEFASRSEILPKEKKIIVYCNAGSRSYMAYRKLMKMEYKNIYQTLFADWKAAGLPVEK